VKLFGYDRTRWPQAPYALERVGKIVELESTCTLWDGGHSGHAFSPHARAICSV